jgi:hypothetical protein
MFSRSKLTEIVCLSVCREPASRRGFVMKSLMKNRLQFGADLPQDLSKTRMLSEGSDTKYSLRKMNNAVAGPRRDGSWGLGMGLW